MQLAVLFSLIPDAINRYLALGRHHFLATQEARDEVATTRDRFFAPLSGVYITLAQHILVLGQHFPKSFHLTPNGSFAPWG